MKPQLQDSLKSLLENILKTTFNDSTNSIEPKLYMNNHRYALENC
jgi:hypothetical protein